MFGWTALLLWANRARIERRDVLVLTVFPVIVGLAVNEAFGVAAGFLPPGLTVPIWVPHLARSALFLGSWSKGKRDAITARG